MFFIARVVVVVQYFYWQYYKTIKVHAFAPASFDNMEVTVGNRRSRDSFAMRTALALALPSVFLMSRWIEAGLRDKKSNNVFEKGSHIVEDCEG